MSEVKPIPELPSVPLVVPQPESQNQVSDMMKFSDTISSYNASEVVLPECSIFDVKGDFIDFWVTYRFHRAPFLDTNSSGPVGEDTEFIPVFSQLLPDTENALNSTQSSNLPDSNQLPFNVDSSSYSESSEIPLTIPQPESPTRSNSTTPNLTINTQLPHFRYTQLEVATNHFSTETGTFLGAGAYGSVFLATGLFDRPVAVKRMSLDNAEGITKDDCVTQQFKNEVEIFSKCKHENLVPLLGYSCDGDTYCLVYEYVPGGSLFDVLQVCTYTLCYT